MMDKIFLDTDILLDIVLRRDGAENDLLIINSIGEDKYRHLYVSFLTMANMAYILRKKGIDSVKNAIKSIMKWCDVLPQNDMQLLSAEKGTSPDFEDELQIACAENKECDLIITRNTEHFRNHTDIPVLTPEEFISHCYGNI